MNTDHYNFFIFAFFHNGNPETKWQTTLHCAETIYKHKDFIRLFESKSIHVTKLPDMISQEVPVYLIRCATPEEREDRLRICTIIIELLKQISFHNPVPTFAWRCARSPEVSISNFPQCFRTTKEVDLFLHPLINFTLQFKFL